MCHKLIAPLLSVVLSAALTGCAMQSDIQGAKSLPVSPVQAVAEPLFWGQPEAPHFLYVYTNPQCPPCRRDWPKLRALLARQEASQLKVAVAGLGFADQGTRLMYAAALLSLHKQDAGLTFLDAVFGGGSAPYIEGLPWIVRWLDTEPAAQGIDRELLATQLASSELAEAWLHGVQEAAQRYKLAGTPSYVLDGQHLPGFAALLSALSE